MSALSKAGQILLQVERLLVADRREREGMEDEQDVPAAAEVGEPHALGPVDLEVELRRLTPRLDRSPSASSPWPEGR